MNLPFDPTTLLATYATAFSQANRALEITHAPGSNLPLIPSYPSTSTLKKP